MESILRIWKGNSGHVRDMESILRACVGYGKETGDMGLGKGYKDMNEDRI
jgi:hypothetical protein